LREEPSSELEYERFEHGKRLPDTLKKGCSISGLLVASASGNAHLPDASKEALIRDVVVTDRLGNETEIKLISVKPEDLAKRGIAPEAIDNARKNTPYVHLALNENDELSIRTNKESFTGAFRAPDQNHGRPIGVRAY
jgi:hypothetical protein